MEEFLNLVEEKSSPQQEASIDSNMFKFFTSKLKIWNYACLNFDDYKKLFVKDCSSLLKSYYVDMASLEISVLENATTSFFKRASLSQKQRLKTIKIFQHNSLQQSLKKKMVS